MLKNAGNYHIMFCNIQKMSCAVCKHFYVCFIGVQINIIMALFSCAIAIALHFTKQEQG